MGAGSGALNRPKVRDMEAEGEEKERQCSTSRKNRKVAKERKGGNDERDKEVVKGK